MYAITSYITAQGTPFPFSNSQTLNVMPGLSYGLDNFTEATDLATNTPSSFLFAVDQSANVTVLSGSTAASGTGNVLALSTALVHVSPGTFAGTYRVGGYLSLAPGPHDIYLIPTLFTTVSDGTNVGGIIPGSCQVVPSTLFTFTFTIASSPCSPGYTPSGTNQVVQPIDTTTGTTSPATLTFSTVTQTGNTSVTTSSTGTPPPSGFKLGNPPTYYEISTTATFTGSVTVCIDYSGTSYGNASALKLFHEDVSTGIWNDITGTNDTTAHVICGSVGSFSPFAVFESAYAATIQIPIKIDGSSVFKTTRGVVPVKFTLTANSIPTCQLPPAAIAVARTSGAAPGPIDQSDYIQPSDNGSSFRIDGCQYIYNLGIDGLGAGTFVIYIKIAGLPIGTARFGLR